MPSSIAKQAKYWTRIGVAGLICLCLTLWSFQSVSSHTSDASLNIPDQVEIVDDHGHSHGFETDLAWANHGHSHDVADHDHNQVMQPADTPRMTWENSGRVWNSTEKSWFSGPSYSLDRPPRA